MNREQYTCEWQFPNDPDEERTIHTSHAPPRQGEIVKVDGERFYVSSVEWSIFKRPEAPGGGCLDVFAVVKLGPAK